MKSTLSSLQDSLEFFSNKFDEFRSQLNGLEALYSRVEKLETNNAQLEKNVAYLTDRLHNLEQSSCNKDLICCGIPEVENEETSTTDLVINLLDITQNAVSKNDIKSA
jgi:predicted nuclease with TOPRIM domain